MNLKQTQKTLMIIFWGYLIVGFLMVFLYELEFLTPTDIGSDANLVFFMQVLMEFVTIAVIPIALKFFAFKPSVANWMN